jgi:hypothetical protein
MMEVLMETTRVYISLIVYDYDRSSRYRRIQHTCKDADSAFKLVGRLRALMGTQVCGGRSGGWLDRTYGIYGFIDKIEGVFEEVTRSLPPRE